MVSFMVAPAATGRATRAAAAAAALSAVVVVMTVVSGGFGGGGDPDSLISEVTAKSTRLYGSAVTTDRLRTLRSPSGSVGRRSARTRGKAAMAGGGDFYMHKCMGKTVNWLFSICSI